MNNNLKDKFLYFCNSENDKDYFSKNYRVIAPALPGFGESHNAQSLNSINAMAKKIIEILDGKNIEKFNLIGHSMGGMIVQEITKLIGGINGCTHITELLSSVFVSNTSGSFLFASNLLIFLSSFEEIVNLR